MRFSIPATWQRPCLVIAALTVACAPAIRAQEAHPLPLASRTIGINIDSGYVENFGTDVDAVFSTIVEIEEASWLRLKFDQLALAGEIAHGVGSFLIITSLADGEFQYLNAEHAAQWSNTSAYFNGNAVLIELYAHPNTGPNRITMSEVIISGSQGIQTTICGATDDRVLSSDARVARVVPIGCTVWMINDCGRCFLTAGHCQSGVSVVQFNVPLSDAQGNFNQPPPRDQYAVDTMSLQGNGGLGAGDDWAYFGVFPNSNTGLTPFEAQGDAFTIAAAPAENGQSIRITGYGSVGAPMPPEWNGVQKTHVGPYVGLFGTAVSYVTDTTGGNSGSPVINEDTGAAIGIHTHGLCSAGGGSNVGTAIQHPGLQAALASPLGVCAAGGLILTLPNGLPTALALNGATIRVEVTANGATPQPGSGRLHFDDGSGFVSVAMQEVASNVYDAVFPPLVCGTEVQFFFSAQATSGETFYEPGGCGPPVEGLRVTAALSVNTILSVRFQMTGGFTVGAPDDDATTGIWNRMNPQGTLAQPEDDHTPGSTGKCWVTDGFAGSSLGEFDVDDGKTTLFSDTYDLTGSPDALIGYWRWYSNNTGAAPNADIFEVDINDGAGWVNVEKVGPSGPGTAGGWIYHEFRVADFVTPTVTIQMRFVASDTDSGSLVEAAIDDFHIREIVCTAPPVGCLGDVNSDGVIDLADLAIVLGNFGMTGATMADGDADGDGDVDLSDLATVLSVFGQTC